MICWCFYVYFLLSYFYISMGNDFFLNDDLKDSDVSAGFRTQDLSRVRRT